MAEALIEIAESLGYSPEAVLDVGATDFTGPIPGSDADPEHLARACWALALLTEMYRNPMAAMMGPLGRFEGRRAPASELLYLGPPAALAQLAAFRDVFAARLLPQFSHRPGRWVSPAASVGNEGEGTISYAGAAAHAQADITVHGYHATKERTA